MQQVYISFSGGGNSLFTPEQRNTVQQSVDALFLSTGLILEQIRSAPDAVEFGLKTTKGVHLATLKYHLDADGPTLYYVPYDVDAIVIEPNRKVFGLL